MLSYLLCDFAALALCDDSEQCFPADVERLGERVKRWNAERPGIRARHKQ